MIPGAFFLNSKIFSNTFFALLFFALIPFTVFAQTATPTSPTAVNSFDPNQTSYSSSDILQIARNQCNKVIAGGGMSSVFGGADNFGVINFGATPGVGSAVTINNAAMLQNIANSTTLLGKIYKEVAERNFSEDCFKTLALANSIQAIKKDLEKTQKKLADNNSSKPKLVAEQVKNKTVQSEIKKIKESKDVQKDAALSGVAAALSGNTSPKYKLSKTQIEDCASGKSVLTYDCLVDMGRHNNPEDAAMSAALDVVVNSNIAGGEVLFKSYASGIAPTITCAKTASGADPAETDWKSDDCIEAEEEPSIVTQEKVKQLVNAPYNQAFSPAAQLGLDGGLSNINQRVAAGKLFEKNVGSNFGTGAGNPNGDLAEQEKNKNGIVNNLQLAIEVEKALIALQASSTSPCYYTPVATRVAAISEATSKITEYTQAKADTEAKWAYVVKNPKLDHTNFFISMSIQLANKWNKDFIQKLVDDFKSKAQVCIDAKAAYDAQVAEAARLAAEAAARASSTASSTTSQ